MLLKCFSFIYERPLLLNAQAPQHPDRALMTLTANWKLKTANSKLRRDH